MNSMIMENLIQALCEQAEIEIKEGDHQQSLFTLGTVKELLGDQPIGHPIYGKITGLYAEIDRYLGRFYSAVNYAREALEFYQIHGMQREVFQTKNFLGDIFFQNCKYQEAIVEWEGALKTLPLYVDEPGIRKLQAQIYIKLGEVFILLSEYRKARTHYVKGLRFSRYIQDQVLVGRFHLGIGATFHLENRFRLALKIYYHTVKLARKNSDKFLIGRLLHSLGDLFTKTDQVAKARMSYEKSLEISEKAKDFVTLVSSLRELGRLYLKLDPEKTMSFYERSFDKLIENISADTRGECERLMGKNFYLAALYYFKIKDYQEAMKNLAEAGEIFYKHNMEKEKKRAHFLYNQISGRPIKNPTPFCRTQDLSQKLGIG